MSTARDYLDAGIHALGLLGAGRSNETALEQFRRAVSVDASMCDAWVGLVVAGDRRTETLRRAHETRATLHRETRRLGLHDTALATEVAAPGFIGIYTYTQGSLTLAYIAALIADGDYDQAEKLLEDYDADREPDQSPIWRHLGASLHYVTQRWSDVLDWAGRSVPLAVPAAVVEAATTLLAGIAHTGLGEYDMALQTLARLQPDICGAEVAATAAFYRGLCRRGLGEEAEARKEFAAATVAGQPVPGTAEALADPTYAAQVTTREAIAARTSRWDPESGPSVEDLRHAQQAQEAKKTLDEARGDLEAFIGLRSVKAHVTKLLNEQIYDRAMQARGQTVGQRSSLHMTLVGPPGTAKTSIARILCRMYFGLGILESREFIEVSRADLVGKHIGDTEAQTLAFLKRAKGCALFVDEAPELYKPDNERDFGKIALDTIMKFAEDHRDDTMIALAGYAAPMNVLLSSNPGIRSRFATRLEFVSNTDDELVQIAALFADQNNVVIDAAALELFEQTAKWLCSTPTGRYDGEMLIDIAANGRYVRNVVSWAAREMKARIAADPTIDLFTADLDVMRTIAHDDMRGAIIHVLTSQDLNPPAELLG